jgi:uncharacterized protein (TIGR02246 family)
MRNRMLCTCIVLVLPCFALAQQPVAASKASAAASSNTAVVRSKVADALEANVRAAWATFKKKDKDGYAKFLSDDFQAVEADGEGERTRLHVLAEVEHCMYTDYLLQFFQVQPLGSDYAFVTYESSMQFPKNATLRFRRVFVGELWAQRNGQWKMMRYQETLVR